MRSRTSVANSGESDATTYSYLVFMPRVLNCASTWTNHMSGSAGQKGGSLRLTAETVLTSPSTDILLCVDRVAVTNVDNINVTLQLQHG